MTDHVLHDLSDGVLTLTLDRLDKKNALTAAMYLSLADHIARAEADPQVRCLLLQANGDMFTAGNDLADFAAGPPATGPLPGDVFVTALAACAKPVVAAVQGGAVGVGVTLLLHCDLVYLAEDARLRAPFVDLALVPEAGSTLLMPARIGHPRAFALFVLGEAMDAATAVTLGLASAMTPAAELRARARAAAIAVAQRPPAAVRAAKALMRPAQAIQSQMQAETRQFLERLASPEAREALAAFADRRQPDFSKFA